MMEQICLEPGQDRPPRSPAQASAMAAARVPPSFGVRAAVHQGTATIVLSGELDLIAVPVLSRQLSAALAGAPRLLVFDLAEVTFIDCAVGRLIAQAGWCLPAGRKPVVSGLAPPVRRLFALTGFAACVDLRS